MTVILEALQATRSSWDGSPYPALDLSSDRQFSKANLI